MEPLNLRFGGGATETMLHPLVAVWLLIAVVLILTLPRSKAITPFLLAFFTIPIGQVILSGGLHFTALRILILAGLVRRAISRGGASEGKYSGGMNGVDWAVVAWTAAQFIVTSLQYIDTTQAIIHALGDFLDVLGGYLVVRFLIVDGDATRRAIKALATICVILAVCMANEQVSHINVFGILGGIPRDVTVRDGHVRSGGVMGCIYAGVFGGILIPLFLSLWHDKKSRSTMWAGLLGAITMVVTSNSSTSLFALFGSIIGLAFWPLRKSMRLVRWGLVALLIGIHMSMKAPVWALIARIDLTGSSSGDHRYQILNSCIRHFGDWWLMGYKNYDQWGWDMWDLCNQFVAVALTGGLISLVFYIAILVRAFGAIGKTRKQIEGNRNQEWVLWCQGSALFAVIFSSFGINYVLQLLMGLFPLLACISVTTHEAAQPVTQTAQMQPREQFAPVSHAAKGGLHLRPRSQ